MPRDAEWRVWLTYWRTAFQERPSAALFAPYRAIWSVLATLAGYLVRRHQRTPTSGNDVWVAIAITIGVYVALWIIAVGFNTVVRSPALLDNRKTSKIEEQDRHRLALEKNAALLSQKLDECEARRGETKLAPVSPQVEKLAREGWNTLSAHEKAAVKLLLDFGDMTDENALKRLGLTQMAIFGAIETKTNFVHRTEGTQPGEHVIGYKGKWKINPHFLPALQQIVKEKKVQE